MSNAVFLRWVCLVWTGLAPVLARAQHAHINAGALSEDPGSRLYFPNGAAFVTNSGYVVHLAAATNGPYAGYFQTGAITFTALPSTGDNGGPAFGHAAPGAHLELRVTSADGPAGGSFGFWESDGESDAMELTFSVPAGEQHGTHQFPLSENDGSAGADPYGHIHGRKFTATVPGLYIVGFEIRDTSVNGPGGGPIHTPSDSVPIYFQAGVTIGFFEPVAGGLQLTFATKSGNTYYVESTEELGADASWHPVAGPLPGNDHLQSATGLSLDHLAAFFRLRVE